MKALNIKLWRQLWNMRLQAIAIGLVIVSGVSIFVMSLSTLDSLLTTRETYYRQHHFAHVFTSLKRAPAGVARRIQEIPGVEKVQTRVVAAITIDVEGFPEPVSGHLLSLPARSVGLLNQIYLRTGRLLEPDRDDEVLVSETFANAHGLKPGGKLRATINGRRKTLSIVGIALSPEYIYEIAPGALFPDHKRYGVLWMAHTPLAAAYDMEGAFNDAAITIGKDTDVKDVIERLDELLKPYGGLGAYERKDQFSNRFLSEELKQQQTIATVFPVIFFGVAAFLLNVVISRLIGLEREQIAILKAFGYSDLQVALHYLQLVLMIVIFGVIGGVLLGMWMGSSLSDLYMMFYRFPFLIYIVEPYVIIAAAAISAGVAVVGAMHALRAAAKMPPAQAMLPEPPAIYHATLVERLGLQRWFSQPTRMILRHIERHSLKSLITVIGIAMACGIMMVGSFQEGAIDYMVDVQYGMSQREDLSITFVEPASERAMYSLASIPGVWRVESYRAAPARLLFEHRDYRTAVQGVNPNGDLQRLLDTGLQVIDLPEDGVILTDYLAELLNIKAGDMLTVEVLEGNRPVVQVPVVGLVKQYLGVSAYMQRRALNRLLNEGDVISGAYLAVDEHYQNQVYAELKDIPHVASIIIQKVAVKMFYETLAETVLFFTFISTMLGATISFGVVYNSMRIALSERDRELASMRVLGYTRGEVAYILLGELAALTLISIPLGLLIGEGLCAYLAYRVDTDLYRIPLILHPDVYAFAASVVIGSAMVSGYMIWRNLAHLDMVAVLKTKE
ncbi:MAG: FtsX-like permease family protein [Gammaproteobacteria bacterium]|nr:FtsX-like permease family protein [Gammaproteobacteria bacterium]